MGFTEPDSAPSEPGQMPASSWDIQAPYVPGSPQEIASPNPDIVAGSVQAAVAAAMAWREASAVPTHAQGDALGIQPPLPAGPDEQSKHTGGSDAGFPS